MSVARPTSKLPPGANRILFVKNLNYNITGEDLYDLFGRYGSIRQIRIGNEQKTKGTAFVVFDDVMDAKNALDHLNGFHLQERYIVRNSRRSTILTMIDFSFCIVLYAPGFFSF
ncbi:hypothetical protein Agabi119p4_5051 [Agaricus bisporus var. burnettii]|uniref:RRM domain-containing protein n=1 Tax=Agaricus bisporus var. burnettii TaxID=192524 RepID=A0A8H7KHZ2_AGABI|nr:hypothetical protein Agabi119p4_5051 [Agaricus bisporus var. burnettii]